MRAIEVIHRSAVGIGREHTVREAAQIMEQSGIGSLAVIDGRELVGVVTDRDLVCRVLASGLPLDSRVDSVMTSPVVTIDADADASAAFEKFRSHGLRRLFVVRRGDLLGVIAIDDLLLRVAEQLGDLCNPIATESKLTHSGSAL